MSAASKTKELLRLDVPLSLLVKNDDNPNKMSQRDFDLLCDNLDRTGLTDAILVRPMDLKMTKAAVEAFNKAKAFSTSDISLAKMFEANGLKFKIVGGHHRYDGAAYLGFETVPITVIMSKDFDVQQEKFQLVRMNMIRGKLDANAFYKIYSQLSAEYSDEILQDAFGFSEEAEFKRLIAQTSKMLPDKNLQQKFVEAAAEIKTIDGLSKLLNEMFTKYGDTLPYGYMVFDHAGQRSMWLRIEGNTMKALDLIGTMCIDKNRTVDAVVGGIMQSIAKGEFSELVEAIVAKTPVAKLPKALAVAPTKDNLEKVAAL